MMMVVGYLFQLGDVHKFRKIVEMEHRFVLTVFAKKGHVLAEVHVLEMVCDETPVTSLNPLAELFYYFLVLCCVHWAMLDSSTGHFEKRSCNIGFNMFSI